MPVAFRKSSWEEHVTHPRGLHYSYDDLDLVCCHGSDGLWLGLEGSKQGRRSRCASLPESCHQAEQTVEVMNSFHLKADASDIDKVKLDSPADAIHSIEHANTDSVYLGYGVSSENIIGATDSSHNSLDTDGETTGQICSNGNDVSGSNALLPLSQGTAEENRNIPDGEETRKNPSTCEVTQEDLSVSTLHHLTDAPTSDKERIVSSANTHAAVLHKPDHSMSLMSNNGQLNEASEIDGNCDPGNSETWNLNLSEEAVLNGHECLSGKAGQDFHDGKGLQDQVYDGEVLLQIPRGKLKVEMTATENPQGEEHNSSDKSAEEITCDPVTSLDICKDQGTDHTEPLECEDDGCTNENPFTEKVSASSLVKESGNLNEDAEQVKDSDDHNSPELDRGGEVVDKAAYDTHPLSNKVSSGSLPNVQALNTEMDDPVNQASKCSDNVESVVPQGHFCESPVLDGADGQSQCSQLEDISCKMEESVQADLTVLCGDTQIVRSDSMETDRHEENTTVKVRTKKHEHARLDSMVLLLMKLDQLDQEIENALSATSSMNSTPMVQRRQLLELDSTSLPEPNPLCPNTTSSLELTPAVRAKPKTGNCHTIPEKEKAEIEAKEACTWLRAAGFPQYAQLYEDAQFPIDISSVTRDHDFLNRDAIEALCRRLNTLNKCALMRLEISPQRKRSEDSDEDEPCAISGRWTFQRDSKRWSRLEELEVFSSLYTDAAQPTFPKTQITQKSKLALCEGNSSESVLSDLSEQPEVGSIHSSGSGGRLEKSRNTSLHSPNEAASVGATRASSVASMCSSSGTGGSGCANEDSLSDGLPPSPLETLGHFNFDVKMGMGGGSLDRSGGSGKSTRSRAKSFLKRMESLRLRSGSSSKRKKKGGAGKIEISGPVIKEGLDEDKLQRLNCVDISSINLNQNLNNYRNPTQTMTLNRNRSVSYSTQTSNGSTGSSGSSQSEASSGSAVSTPSPVTRARSHSTAAGSSKRGGMYLEGFDPFSIVQQASEPTPPPKSAPPVPCRATNGMTVMEQNCKNNHSDKSRQVEEEDDGMIFFYLPEGHKPGTFPKALQDGSSRNNNGNDNGNSVILRGRQSRRQRHTSSGSVDSRLSFYDNVQYTGREEDVEEEEGNERKLDEVLQHVSGLQHFVNAWSEAVAREEEEDDDEEEGDSDSALDSASPCPSSPLQNQLEETENGSDQDSTGNPLGEGEDGNRERRDSCVGASLTRTSRPQKMRWPSFQNSHRPSSASAQLQISCQSVLQMNLLQKLSLLQLTALLERHTPTNKHGFSWAVPKFMKRIKVRDYKDRNVFGVPLQVIVQRTGQPLPQGIQQAMRYLRNQCLDQVGLFRKSGVKSRIQALRQMNESSGSDGGAISYEGQSAYDVADMLKQYFRDLPEPLLTSKLSETFLQIYQYMPKELRLQAARAAVLLLPDENREALRTLLCLLSDVTASVAENQMTPTNLAVCLAPSLFHLNTLRRKESSSPRVMNRKPTLGKPDQRDLNENLAATHGLAHMIQECRKLFRIPEEMNRCRNSYVEQALLPRPLEELGGEEAGQQGYRAFLRDSMDALLKEAKDKFRGYDSFSTPEQVELSCRKVHDGFPLRLWKATVEVPAAPEEVLTRVLREQGHWDEDLCESRVVETLDERTEVYQYVRNTMAPHPSRDHLVLRTWITDLPKGACALVCTSVDHDAASVLGVRVNVLTSRYFIEPCGGNKSRLTHISRIDCRGRFPEWYNKLYGHLSAAEVARIRDSFTSPVEK
ncbi:rho GTPase-activating protein 7 isoform 1-T1 [Synchiropus picturatus]